MGYTLSVSAPTADLQNKMFNFLRRNLKPCPDTDPVAARLDTLLSYCPDDIRHPMGFDYSSWIDITERIYIHRVLEWMADTLGCPGYYYDNELLTDPPLTREKAYEMYISKSAQGDIRKAINFAYDEVERLDALWKEKYENG